MCCGALGWSVKAAAPAPSGPRDNLAAIKGVDPYTAQRLADRGIATFDQVASLSEAEIADIEAEFGIPGRFRRFSWVYQARNLANE